MAERIYTFAAVSFRNVVEQIISKDYISPNLEPDYLNCLKQYFSSFVHDQASNIIVPDIEDMTEWVKAVLDKKESVLIN